MRWLLLLSSAVLALTTLTACSTSTPPISVPYKPLPAALLTPCPPPAALMNNHADAALIALKELYDQYGECAGRHLHLINHLETPHGRD